MLKFIRMADPSYAEAPVGGVSRGEFDDLVALVRRIDSRLAMLERMPQIADQARWYHRDELGAAPPAGDVAGALAAIRPWVSTRARFAESLTSPQFVWTTLGEAGIAGLSIAGIAGIVALVGQLPWEVVPISGLAGAALAGGLLVLINRTELHRLVSGSAAGGRSRQELQITVTHEDGGRLGRMQLLMVAGITEAQVREFAQRVIAGAGLQVKSWSGRGALFSETQYTALMTECERFGFVQNAGGNVGRSPTTLGKRILARIAEE